MAGQYLRKGSQVYFEESLRTDKHTTGIHIEQVQAWQGGGSVLSEGNARGMRAI